MALPSSTIEAIDVLYDAKLNAQVIDPDEWNDNFTKLEGKVNELVATSNTYLTELTNLLSGGFTYEDNDWRDFIKKFFTNGIIAVDGNSLDPFNNGNSLITYINEGKVHIDGYVKEWTGDTAITHQAAHSTYSRYDVIVARLTYSTKSIDLALITGVPAASPAVPAYTRDANYYDLSLATVLVPNGVSVIPAANITDNRWNDAICGFSKTPYMQQFDDENNLLKYNRAVTATDAYGQITEVTYRRQLDSSLFMKRSYSLIDSSNRYTKCSEVFYLADGSTIYKTVSYVFTYLANGQINTCVKTIGNAAPQITSVSVTGTARVGYTLTAAAVGYYDAENDSAGTHLYQWKICATEGGTYTNISAATAATYVVVAGDLNKFIKCQITPKALTGTVTGTAVLSAATSAVIAA